MTRTMRFFIWCTVISFVFLLFSRSCQPFNLAVSKKSLKSISLYSDPFLSDKGYKNVKYLSYMRGNCMRHNKRELRNGSGVVIFTAYRDGSDIKALLCNANVPSKMYVMYEN